MEIGKRIKELRIASGLTQKELAVKLSIGQATISEWEQGKYEPTASALRQLAIFFDISADYLLEIKEYDGTERKTTTKNVSFNANVHNNFGIINNQYKPK